MGTGQIEITKPEETTEVEMAQEKDAEAGAPKAVHHATVKSANLAVARKEISADSCRTVIAGELSLKQAKSYGRDADRHGRPVQSETPKKKAPKKPKSGTCICGCQGETKGGRILPGHDMKVFRIAREHLTEGCEISPELREYLESSGKMQRVKDKLADEEAKRVERTDAKADAQRAKDGE